MPSKLTPDLAKRIVDYAAEGKRDSWISVSCDLSLKTVGDWLRRGRKEDSGPYHDLARRVDMARNPERALTGGELPEGVTLRKKGGKKQGALPHPAKRVRAPAGLAAVTEITPELHESIVSALEKGNYLDVAASANGVPPKVVMRWLSRGAEDREGPYAEFAAAVMRSNAAAQGTLLGRMWDLSDSHEAKTAQQATQWLLERRFGGHWAERMNRDARQTISHILSIVEDEVSPDQYSAILQRLSGDSGGAVAEAVTGAAVAGCLPVGE